MATPPAASVSGEQLLRWRRQLLQGGGSPSDLDWLLDLQGGVGWQQLQQLRLRPQDALQLETPLPQLEQLWWRHRSSGEPLQYLVGRCPWRNFQLQVAPGVLIPRQETELLIDLAEALIGIPGPGLWADLGTGSGCLAIALATAWPTSLGVAVDCSTAALDQARANLTAQGLTDRVSLRQGNWWEPLQDHWGRLEMVLANPPYIPTAVWQQLDPGVRDHEPALALDGGADGLSAIHAIGAGALTALAPGGWLLLEHHHDQAAAVQALLHQAGLVEVSGHRDLEGVERFASGRAPVRP